MTTPRSELRDLVVAGALCPVPPRPDAPPPGIRLPALATDVLVRTGAGHLAAGRPCQDHATSLVSRDGVVLAVADGCSRVNGAPSRAEVGASLVAELAAQAAHDAVSRGCGPGDVRALVAVSLTRHLAPLWGALGDAAGSLLHCTLVLGVVAPAWTSIWVIGDGSWGAAGVLAHGWGPPRRAGELWTRGRGWAACGSEAPLDRRGDTVARVCRDGDPGTCAGAMREVLAAEGPVTALYVASDGLDDEPTLAEALELVLRGGPTRAAWVAGGGTAGIDEILLRHERCDDLAVAWAVERRPGLLGLASPGDEAEPFDAGGER